MPRRNVEIHDENQTAQIDGVDVPFRWVHTRTGKKHRVAHIEKGQVPKMPAYELGVALPVDKSGLALVRSDVPKRVERAVTDHEFFHLEDDDQNGRLIRETMAYFHEAVHHPLGFIQATGIYLKEKFLSLLENCRKNIRTRIDLTLEPR